MGYRGQVRRTMSARELVFRVTRFNAFSGLLYDVVTMFRRPRGGPPGNGNLT